MTGYAEPWYPIPPDEPYAREGDGDGEWEGYAASHCRACGRPLARGACPDARCIVYEEPRPMGEARDPLTLVDDRPDPSGDDRFAVYAVTLTGRRRRIAETSLEGVGLTLLTLAGEGEFVEGPADEALRVGLFDRRDRVWVVSPWAKGRP